MAHPALGRHDEPDAHVGLDACFRCRFRGGRGTEGTGHGGGRRALSRCWQPGPGRRRSIGQEPGSEPGAATKPRLPSQPAGRARNAAQPVGRDRQLECPVPPAGNIGRHHDVGAAFGLHLAGRLAAAQSAGGEIRRKSFPVTMAAMNEADLRALLG
jgi:hypothetical protein